MFVKCFFKGQYLNFWSFILMFGHFGIKQIIKTLRCNTIFKIVYKNVYIGCNYY